MTSKIAYQNLLKPLLSAPTAQRSLERELKLTDIDWTKIYTLPKITTIELSLRTFQYNILNNNLYLNEEFFKSNMVENWLMAETNRSKLKYLCVFKMHILNKKRVFKYKKKIGYCC